MCCEVFCTFSADRPDHLMLFRKYVSRKAATKGRAVLEGVGLLTETINACFSSHPLNEEGAVQAGLTEWSGGQSHQPPTWEVLTAAMEYANIAQQHIEDLRKELCTRLVCCCTLWNVCVCVCVCVQIKWRYRGSQRSGQANKLVSLCSNLSLSLLVYHCKTLWCQFLAHLCGHEGKMTDRQRCELGTPSRNGDGK